MFELIARWLLKKYDRKQVTYCFCPKCGIELCMSGCWYSDNDLVTYSCNQCGHSSSWLFDVPAPILVKGRIEKQAESEGK